MCIRDSARGARDARGVADQRGALVWHCAPTSVCSPLSVRFQYDFSVISVPLLVPPSISARVPDKSGASEPRQGPT